MPAPNASTPADGPRIPQIVLWTAFTAILVLGLVLYFLFAGSVVPILDAVGVS